MKRRISESVLNRIIREAIKSEAGMSDNDKRRRRNKRYEDDVFGKEKQMSRFDRDTFSPTEIDRLSDEAMFHHEGWYDDEIEHRRRLKHKAKRGVKKNGNRKNDDIDRIVKESVERMLKEGFFDKFRKKSEPEVEPGIENETPKNHIYTAKELQWLYDNQNGLNDIERKVLSAAMWVRAMMANYHGYTKEWHDILFRDGKLYYYHNGKLMKTPNN